MKPENTIKPTSKDDVLGVVYYALDAIKALGKNFKNHDTEGIARSIQKRGLLTAIGIDEISGENFDGNGRVEALALLKSRADADPESKPPRKVIERGGRWFVPVLTGVAFESEAERVAAAATLNRLNEIGGYDAELQADVLTYLQQAGELDDTGYDDGDVAELISKLHFDEDDEVSDAPDTKKAGGIKTKETAQMSAIRQMQLAFTPEVYAQFLKLSVDLSQKLGTTDVSATVVAAMQMLSSKPHVFDPNLKPEVVDGHNVTAGDVQKAATKLNDKFGGEQKLIPVMCPTCATEFEINPALN